MPHLKKSTKFWVKTQNGRAHNRSLGVDVMILKQHKEWCQKIVNKLMNNRVTYT